MVSLVLNSFGFNELSVPRAEQHQQRSCRKLTDFLINSVHKNFLNHRIQRFSKRINKFTESLLGRLPRFFAHSKCFTTNEARSPL